MKTKTWKDYPAKVRTEIIRSMQNDVDRGQRMLDDQPDHPGAKHFGQIVLACTAAIRELKRLGKR